MGWDQGVRGRGGGCGGHSRVCNTVWCVSRYVVRKQHAGPGGKIGKGEGMTQFLET